MVLVELNKQIRDSRETKRKVKASLMYPMILICVAVSPSRSCSGWSFRRSPRCSRYGCKLPAITQYVVDASDWIVKYGHLLSSSASSLAVIGFKKF